MDFKNRFLQRARSAREEQQRTEFLSFRSQEEYAQAVEAQSQVRSRIRSYIRIHIRSRIRSHIRIHIRSRIRSHIRSHIRIRIWLCMQSHTAVYFTACQWGEGPDLYLIKQIQLIQLIDHYPVITARTSSQIYLRHATYSKDYLTFRFLNLSIDRRIYLMFLMTPPLRVLSPL